MILPPLRPEKITALVFDLDGTLYVSRPFSREIFASAQGLAASRLGVTFERAGELIRESKRHLAAATACEASLTAACEQLGIPVHELHRHMAQTVHPENFLSPDPRVVALLEALGREFSLVLYTNNNLNLCGRILERIGCAGLFETVVSIEDFWHPKPYRPAIEAVLRDLAKPAEECLFIGDRADIDLKLPVEMGAQGWLVRELDDLLALGTLLGRRIRE